ncbi:MAG: EamA/RhaT family transporter [Betaproteobacteria bacterium]|nr:EamA/RhaT family transporter [Betaproteobacteria bacterium]
MRILDKHPTAIGESQALPADISRATACVGGVSQILGTGLMLAAMREKSFVVATALTKIEPVWVALFGLVLLGDLLSLSLIVAIGAATAGVLVMSWPGRGAPWSIRPIVLGLASGALFAVAAIGFRASIKALETSSFVLAASLILCLGFIIQTALLLAFMLWKDRQTLLVILRAWRPSLVAGALGAFASQAWFLAFAVESAARVRTLALVEIAFAQVLSKLLLRQRTTNHEWFGMFLLLIGVVLVLRS